MQRDSRLRPPTTEPADAEPVELVPPTSPDPSTLPEPVDGDEPGLGSDVERV